jgi:hypothetical protein
MSNALASLFQSRKTVRAMLGTVVVLIALWSTWGTFNTPEARSAALIGALVSVAGLFGIDIRGIALEDAALKSAPTQQVNVGSDVQNPPAAPTSPPADWVPVRDVVPTPPPTPWGPIPTDKPKGT